MKLLKFLPLLAIIACNENNATVAVQKQAVTTEQNKAESRPLTKAFKDYWYAGTAEISSYDLKQARYGEMRNGTAVMVFVTEPMDAQAQVKADQPKDSNIPVLKLNATRNFNTGIYPYSMMSSTFLPLNTKVNATKITASIQEWCGHTFMQFNNRNGSYDVMLHSYFQSEGDTIVTIDDILTENQIPAQLRLGPQAMPQGSFNIIPSAEFLRLKHVQTAATKAIASLTESDSQFVYSVEMPDLNRIITYTTSNQFPYMVMEWTDSYEDGGTMMETTATLKKTIQSAYWSKNSNADEYLRKELGL